MHFGHFGSVDRFEPAKAFLLEGAYLCEAVEMFTKLWYNKIKKRGELNEEKVYLANET